MRFKIRYCTFKSWEHETRKQIVVLSRVYRYKHDDSKSKHETNTKKIEQTRKKLKILYCINSSRLQELKIAQKCIQKFWPKEPNLVPEPQVWTTLTYSYGFINVICSRYIVPGYTLVVHKVPAPELYMLCNTKRLLSINRISD